jgi:hypothetical protein
MYYYMARQLMRLQESHEQQRKHHQWGHWAEKRNQGSQAGGWGQMTAWDLEQKAAVQQNASLPGAALQTLESPSPVVRCISTGGLTKNPDQNQDQPCKSEQSHQNPDPNQDQQCRRN